MLLELAIGDAYGAGFEYVNRQLIRQFNTLSRYVQHPRHGTRPGQYTDDAQMTLTIAEAIISGETWTPLNLATRFVDVFKRDPREGYASSFHAFLRKIADGEAFLTEIIPTSDKSGAAMRSIPIGIFGQIDEVIEKATLQAAITHNTVDGINASVATALMSHYFLYNLGPKKALGEFIEEYVDGEWKDEWRAQVGPKGWMSVKAAITAIHQHDSLSNILKASIEYSGDVDTVSTIALGAAASSQEIEQDLPITLIEGLENKDYGRDYLITLNDQLMALVQKA